MPSFTTSAQQTVRSTRLGAAGCRRLLGCRAAEPLDERARVLRLTSVALTPRPVRRELQEWCAECQQHEIVIPPRTNPPPIERDHQAVAAKHHWPAAVPMRRPMA
jgi:hypothetical protein